MLDAPEVTDVLNEAIEHLAGGLDALLADLALEIEVNQLLFGVLLLVRHLAFELALDPGNEVIRVTVFLILWIAGGVDEALCLADELFLLLCDLLEPLALLSDLLDWHLDLLGENLAHDVLILVILVYNVL